MCGIVALFGSFSVDQLRDALHRISHRGQDSSSIHSVPNGILGFQRLAINDPSELGNQPIVHKHLVGVFNAEIYNADNLREQFNFSTTSSSDTAVILPLFERFGPAVIDVLDGFYSGVILNTRSNKIFTLRDYIGKKPLLHGFSRETQFITSELKAFTQIDQFSMVPKGVGQLEEGKIALVRKHQMLPIPPANIREALQEAVAKRIPRQQSKVGVFISGGLDSSIIAALVARHSIQATYYFLGDESSPDYPFTKELMERLGLISSLSLIPLPKPKDLDQLIAKVVYHTESFNPSIISNGLATYVLSNAAKSDGQRVILSGEGADELFCGYPLSSNPDEWYQLRSTLIQHLHTTELRRLDLSSMAHTIEVRCPFLDKKVFAIADACPQDLLIFKEAGRINGKQILRKNSANILPPEIVNRPKVSFDVGSGIRRLVVTHLTQEGETERARLQRIWANYFPPKLQGNSYFSTYPVFDPYINNRGTTHQNP